MVCISCKVVALMDCADNVAAGGADEARAVVVDLEGELRP